MSGSVVCLICQRYKFKSKSQLVCKIALAMLSVFDMSKIQIQKQITTVQMNLNKQVKVCLICQRYKFKSKSQRCSHLFLQKQSVFDMSKIQIQKQITTSSKVRVTKVEVCLICQRYKFKSKSQLRNYTQTAIRECV